MKQALIIDDDEASLGIYQKVLNDLGFEPDVLKNPAEAIACFRDGDHDRDQRPGLVHRARPRRRPRRRPDDNLRHRPSARVRSLPIQR